MKALIHVFHLNLAIRDWCEHLKKCTLIAQNLKRPTRNVVISFDIGARKAIKNQYSFKLFHTLVRKDDPCMKQVPVTSMLQLKYLMYPAPKRF